MTDQALDKLMRQVLIDSLALEEDSAEPVNFNSSKLHEQQMQLMLKNPLGWYKRKTNPIWKLALQRVAVVLLIGRRQRRVEPRQGRRRGQGVLDSLH